MICFIYTISLFATGICVEKKSLQQNEDAATSISSPDEESKKGDAKLWVSMLYALGILSLGTAGFLLSINIYDCAPKRQSARLREGSKFRGEPVPSELSVYKATYEVNTTFVPEDVQVWFDNSYKTNPTSFSYLPEVNTLLFSGNNGTNNENHPWYKNSIIFKSVNGNKPTALTNVYMAQSFVTSQSADTTCFIGNGETSSDNSGKTVFCTNDGNVFREIPSTEIFQPMSLLWKDDTLWVDGTSDNVDWTSVLYSVNPQTMETTLHSYKADDDMDGSPFEPLENCVQNKAIISLFLSAIPVTILSIVLWIKKKYPSLPVTGYVGISFSMSLIVYAARDTLLDGVFFKWWFSLTSAAWLFGLFFLYILKRVQKDTLDWSMNFSGLLYFGSMIALIGAPGQYGDWWRWLLINILTFVPIPIVGVVCEKIILISIGAIGVFIDVWKVADSLANIGAFDGFKVPVYFVVFTVSGLILGFIGLRMSKKQRVIQDFVFSLAERYLTKWMKRPVTTDKQQEDPEAPVVVYSDEAIPLSTE